jgi:hypothetical protein
VTSEKETQPKSCNTTENPASSGDNPQNRQEVMSEKETQPKSCSTTENPASSGDKPHNRQEVMSEKETQFKFSSTTGNPAGSGDSLQDIQEVTSEQEAQSTACSTTENPTGSGDNPQNRQEVISEQEAQPKACNTTENLPSCGNNPQTTNLTGNTTSVVLEEAADARVSSASTQTEYVESSGQVTVDSLVEETEEPRKVKGRDDLINTRLGPYTRSKSTSKKLPVGVDSVPIGPKALR